jgi:hypothetical protein
MKKVDFFIAGNLKSGTTTYYGLLKQNPEIFVPEYKEPKFFCTDLHRESDEFHGRQVNYPIRTIERYNQLYEDAKEGQLLGDCSPHYTFSKEAAKNIYEYNPEAKIIIFLREPVSFLRSLHFDSLHALNETEEDFLKALELEEDRKRGKNIPPKISAPSYLYYSDWVKYKEQIERFVDLFGKENVKIVFLKEIIEDERRVYRDILKFVGVNNVDFNPDFLINKNSSRKVRFGFILKALKHSKFWDIAYKLIPVKMYSFLERIFNRIFFKKANKPQLAKEDLITLKKKYYPEVKVLNDYLNKNRLVKYDLIKYWDFFYK